MRSRRRIAQTLAITKLRVYRLQWLLRAVSDLMTGFEKSINRRLQRSPPDSA